MNRPRPSVARLMGVVALVAVGLALARPRHGHGVLPIFGPMAAAFLVAAWRLLARRLGPFGLGFLAAGGLASLTLAVTVAWYMEPGPFRDRGLVERVSMGPWDAYLMLLPYNLYRFDLHWGALDVMVIMNAPQFAAGWAGGCLSRLVARKIRPACRPS